MPVAAERCQLLTLVCSTHTRCRYAHSEPPRSLQGAFVERQLKLVLPFLHVRSTARLRSPQRALQPVDRCVREQNQLLVLQGHLIRSVFKRLVLKVWETVVYYMWNWLVPSCPRHNYITERCMPVCGSLPPAFTTRGHLDT